MENLRGLNRGGLTALIGPIETGILIVCIDHSLGNVAAEKYLEIVAEAIRDRRAIPQPLTIAQLQALVDFYPDIAKPLLPPPDELARLGMSRFSCREIPSLSLEWREQFITTLTNDADFRATVAELLKGGG